MKIIYNEKQKIRYIENARNNGRYENTTLEVVKRIFEGSAKVEIQENMDLANFNRLQVINLLKSYNSKNNGYYRLICTIFSDYYNWCLVEKLVDNRNVTNWYDVKLSKCIIDDILPIELIKDKYFTKDEVLGYLEKIPDVVNKFIVYAVFRGIDGINHNDLKYLRLNDLDEKQQTVQLYSGRIQCIDQLFIELIKKANESKVYNPQGMENQFNKTLRNNYDQSIYVLKPCRRNLINNPISNQIIVARMSLIKKQVDNKFISVSSLYKNGLINYINEHYERQDISLKDVLFHQKNKKLYTYDEETQKVINEFGSNMSVRMLRMQIADVIQHYS